MLTQKFTAIYQKRGKWYLGWIEEIPGVNTQGNTLEETKSNLKEALQLILEINRSFAKANSTQKLFRETMILRRNEA